jgi:hypothetical protein
MNGYPFAAALGAGVGACWPGQMEAMKTMAKAAERMRKKTNRKVKKVFVKYRCMAPVYIFPDRAAERRETGSILFV